VGLLSSFGGFNDGGFNESIFRGFSEASLDFPMVFESRACYTLQDLKDATDYFVNAGFNLIIVPGMNAAPYALVQAATHPSQVFAFLDFETVPVPKNATCVVFDVDQASFPCGFLSAWWAYSHSINPGAGFVGGPEIPAIRQFSVSYQKGIEYFNSIYHKQVASRGYFATSFDDTLQGAKLADSLILQGFYPVFAFAGKTGNGALYKAKEAGKWAIGVDVDQYYSIPDVGPVLLTSCMKQLGTVTYGLIENFYNFKFPGGQVIHGTLANKGVGIAPFHDFEPAVPDSIRQALTEIQEGIKNGTISTGWPE
jgi:basic membrane protein A